MHKGPICCEHASKSQVQLRFARHLTRISTPVEIDFGVRALLEEGLPACVRELIDIDNAFYADHAASFSATRSAPWQGWEQLAELLRRRGGPWAGEGGDGTGGTPAAVHVLDLACGNLRFERFLREAFPELTFTFHAYDSCPDLVEEGAGESRPASADEGTDGGGCLDVRFHELDVLDALLKRMDASPAGGETNGPAVRAAAGRENDSTEDPLLDVPPCALTACFGFMHHVPGGALRRAVLDALVDATAPGGIVAVSFWRFMDDPRLARKARTADAAAAADPPFEGFSPIALEPGDHFLGWQDDTGPLRYCHHFDEAEIDELASGIAPRARETARFSADDASDTLNRYLVLQKL